MGYPQTDSLTVEERNAGESNRHGLTRGRKPVLKTGRATRPTHSEVFDSYSSTPPTGIGGSGPSRRPCGWSPRWGRGTGAQAGERYLTLLPTGGLYLFQNAIGGLAGSEKVPAEPHHLPPLEQQPERRS